MTGNVFFGDVGSAVFEEINEIPDPMKNAGVVTNFGWPCLEGKDGISDMYQNYLG